MSCPGCTPSMSSHCRRTRTRVSRRRCCRPWPSACPASRPTPAASARSPSAMRPRSSWRSRTQSPWRPGSIGFSAMPGLPSGSPGPHATVFRRSSGSGPCSTGWKRCFAVPPTPIATGKPRSRFAGRARVVARALVSRAMHGGRRSPPRNPERVLLAHHLLLGDTLMLTALVAKLRERHPAAELLMALPDAYAPLYAQSPYGLRAIGWDPRNPAASPLWRERGFDLALVPGDNRFSWLALALDAGWSDMVAGLLDGPPPAPYRVEHWPAPPVEPGIAYPSSRYAVLHVGASTPLKRWDSLRWAALAARF